LVDFGTREGRDIRVSPESCWKELREAKKGRERAHLESEDGSEVVDEVPCGDLDKKVISSVLDAAIDQLKARKGR